MPQQYQYQQFFTILLFSLLFLFLVLLSEPALHGDQTTTDYQTLLTWFLSSILLSTLPAAKASPSDSSSSKGSDSDEGSSESDSDDSESDDEDDDDDDDDDDDEEEEDDDEEENDDGIH